jgi:hypothetical protein
MPATNPAPPDTETTGLTAGEQAFTRQHAAAWARVEADRSRACEYAAWYVEQFVPAARTMADLPAHSHVWPRFLESLDAWKWDLCEARVTLNGERAKISGARNDYATIRIASSGLGCDWAWETVARIVAAGGDFRS